MLTILQLKKNLKDSKIVPINNEDENYVIVTFLSTEDGFENLLTETFRESLYIAYLKVKNLVALSAC